MSTENIQEIETKEPDIDMIDPLSDLFQERDAPLVDAQNKPQEDKKNVPIPLAPTKKKESSDTSDDTSEVKTNTKDEIDAKSDPSKEEIDEIKKRLSENQRYAHKHVQKVKSASKIALSLVEDGSLTQEEAQSLLQALQSDTDDPDEEEYYKGSSHPFASIFKIANKELENIRKYTDDDKLDEKVSAFDYFLSIASPEEIKEAYEDLEDLKDDPVKLTKKMLSIGASAYEETYKHIKDSGGIKNHILQKEETINKLQKKIDKLEKKLAEYSSYDKATYHIDEVANVDRPEEVTEDPLTSMFNARDTGRRR